MRYLHFFLLSLLTLSLGAQSGSGLASWYGQPFHGRRTASGETFDMNQYTGAHRTLPFGTRVRVTLLSSGRSVVVRINDRGPFVENRIIDLSRAAAQEIGLLPLGVGRVQIEVLDNPETLAEERPITSPQPVAPPTVDQPRTPVASEGSVNPVFVQMIALSSRERALQYARDLARLELQPQIRSEGSIYRVFLQVEERNLASVESRLNQAGYRDWQTRRRPIPGNTVTID